MSDLFPIFLKLEGRRVLVAGGGAVAAGRVHQLLRAKARVTVISPRAQGSLARLAQAGKVKLVRRRLRRSDLAAAWSAVFSATDDSAAQRMVVEESRRRRWLCNVADQPEQCDFYMPAMVRRGGLTIAIGTGGSSPYLAGRLRRSLEHALPDQAAELTKALGTLRARLKLKLPRDARRRKRLIGEFVERILGK